MHKLYLSGYKLGFACVFVCVCVEREYTMSYYNDKEVHKTAKFKLSVFKSNKIIIELFLMYKLSLCSITL